MRNVQKKNGRLYLIPVIIFFLLSAAFICYGIYMVTDSFDYIEAYRNSSMVTSDNILQYIVSSSMAYFGFGILSAAAAFIMLMIHGMQSRLSCVASDSVPAEEDLPEEITEAPAPVTEYPETTEDYAVPFTSEPAPAAPAELEEPLPEQEPPMRDAAAYETAVNEPVLTSEHEQPEQPDMAVDAPLYEPEPEPQPEPQQQTRPEPVPEKAADHTEDTIEIQSFTLEDLASGSIPSESSHPHHDEEAHEKISSSMIKDIFEKR